MIIDNKKLAVSGRYIKVACLQAEWLEDKDSPASIAEKIKGSGEAIDIFTFWQRLPNTEPKYDYHMEWDNVAGIRITS